jgi:aquaporin Z
MTDPTRTQRATASTSLTGRAHHMFETFEATAEDFHNPNQEWRRLFSELLGTFFLVLVAAGGGMMGQAFPGTISRTAAVVAPGLMVLAIILFMGKVSGAHLNPAVSFAFALRRDFPWWRVPGYVLVQLGGAALAAWFLQAVVHVSAVYGSNYPAADASSGDAFWMERCSRSAWSASSSAPRRAPRTSASSGRSASARTSRSPGCGAARSRVRR